jgi:DNA-binding NtrC family response regulator
MPVSSDQSRNSSLGIDASPAATSPGAGSQDHRELSEIEQIAASDVTVLLGGETGSGKGRLARQIHAQSRRAGKSFIAVDCAALPDSLFESQMFGHKKGSFTGATSDRAGLIRSADGGTLFLDEIGELPLEQQAKLLTFIQERTVLPVGGADRIACDVRLIVATHRDLYEMVQRGEFREDLFYRIAVIEMSVPPLRSRRDELPSIVHEFLETKSELLNVEPRRPTEQFMSRLMDYDWPGNVRELGNVIERSLVLSRGPYLEEYTLPQRVRDAGLGHCPSPGPQRLTPRTARLALEECHGNKSEAARQLGISRRHLYRVLEKPDQIPGREHSPASSE